MRDRRFITEHRGGTLTHEQHVELMRWAIACAGHVLPLAGSETDPRLAHALQVAKAWMAGESSVGDARKSAVACHAAAREAADPVASAVARACGHAVATAHMADHSLGPAWYALKAVEASGGDIDAEREWQDSCLAAGVRDLVIDARARRRI